MKYKGRELAEWCVIHQQPEHDMFFRLFQPKLPLLQVDSKYGK